MDAVETNRFDEIGPILKDGVTAGALLNEETRTLRARAFMDPEIFDLEIQKLFTKSWNFVAHESELRRPGDFVMRTIGLDPVVVSRSADGNVNVLLNSCAHRGGRVCREEFGNARSFRCPYHGWAYDNTGRLTGVPGEREAFGGALGDKSRHGLRRARVESFHGLIFATWNLDGPTLVDYLGDYAFYLETVLKIKDWEVAGPPHRWVVDCNWKVAADNFAGDGYHTAFVHGSVEQVLSATLTAMGAPDSSGALWRSSWAVDVDIPGKGHSAYCAEARFALTPEQEAATGLSEEQLRMVRGGGFPTLGSVFPNFSHLAQGEVMPQAGPALTDPFNTIRVWAPLTPDTMEVWSWGLVDSAAPADVKRRYATAAIQTFGPSGTFESDDSEVWSEIQRQTRGAMGRDHELIYLSSRPEDPEDWQDGKPWPGPGAIHKGFNTEDAQWNWWRRWRASICE